MFVNIKFLWARGGGPAIAHLVRNIIILDLKIEVISAMLD